MSTSVLTLFFLVAVVTVIARPEPSEDDEKAAKKYFQKMAGDCFQQSAASKEEFESTIKHYKKDEIPETMKDFLVCALEYGPEPMMSPDGKLNMSKDLPKYDDMEKCVGDIPEDMDRREKAVEVFDCFRDVMVSMKSEAN